MSDDVTVDFLVQRGTLWHMRTCHYSLALINENLTEEITTFMRGTHDEVICIFEKSRG